MINQKTSSRETQHNDDNDADANADYKNNSYFIEIQKYVSDTIIKFSHVIANLVPAQLVL